MQQLPPGHASQSKENTTLIQANIRSEIYNYFHRMALTRGWRQQVVCAIMEKFYDAAQAVGCLDHFDPTNEPKLATLLAQVNFIDITPILAENAALKLQLAENGKSKRTPKPKTPSA